MAKGKNPRFLTEEEAHQPAPEVRNPLPQAQEMLTRAMHAVKTGASKHGDTEESFQMIAEMWTVYLRHVHDQHGQNYHIVIRPADIGVMMAMLKIARLTYSYDFDSYVDAAGYMAIAVELAALKDND